MHGGFIDEIEELREKLVRVERERDEYQQQVHTLTERVNNMTSAATSAAATAEAAINKLIAAKPVLDAAESLSDYVEGVTKPNPAQLLFYAQTVTKAVVTHRKGRPS